MEALSFDLVEICIGLRATEFEQLKLARLHFGEVSASYGPYPVPASIIAKLPSHNTCRLSQLPCAR
jgi:hypothetical protein